MADNKITSASPSTPRNIQPRATGQVRRTAFPTLENMSPKPAMEAKEEQSPLPIHSTQGLNQHYIKPFVLVNVSVDQRIGSLGMSPWKFSRVLDLNCSLQNMLRCKFCAHQTSTPQAMRDHLQANHVLVCRACGSSLPVAFSIHYISFTLFHFRRICPPRSTHTAWENGTLLTVFQR